MDILNLYDYGKTYTFELKDANEIKPLGIFITVKSLESPELKNKSRDFLNDLLKLQSKNKHLSGSESLDQEYALIAFCVAAIDWGSNTYNGKKPDFSYSFIHKLVKNNSFIYAQIRENASNSNNFLGSGFGDLEDSETIPHVKNLK